MQNIIKLLKALSDPTRLRIMLLLVKEELCVCELETVLAMEQSRLSHALRALSNAGLIEERRGGRWIFYKGSANLPHTLAAYLEDSMRENPDISKDRRNARKLIESAKPSGKRCPIREKS
jgi:ArsR family transcriptional regulator